MAAPTHVRSAAASSGTATSSTTSFNAVGGDLLVVVIANLNSDAPSGVTFNGAALTEFPHGLADDSTFYDFTGEFSIWYRIAPASTTANVVVTWPSAVEFEVTIHLFNGAHQTTPLVNMTSLVHLNGNNASSFSRSPTSTTDHLIIAALATFRWDLPATSGASQTRLAAGSDGAGGDAGWLRVDSKAGASGSTTVSFSFGSAVAATLLAFGVAAPSGGAFTLTADAGALTLTGGAANLVHGYRASADAGALALTGADAALSHGYRVPADVAALTLTGAAAGLVAGRKLAADAGALALAGADAGLLHGYRITAELAALALTGADAALVHGYRVTAEAGALALTGAAAALQAARRLAADAGALVLTGADAALTYSALRTLLAEAGALTLAGGDAALARGLRYPADAAALSLAGADVAFTRALRHLANAGALVLVGEDAELAYSAGATLIAELGALVLTGADIAFEYTPIWHGPVTALAVARLLPIGSGAFALAPASALAELGDGIPVAAGPLERDLAGVASAVDLTQPVVAGNFGSA